MPSPGLNPAFSARRIFWADISDIGFRTLWRSPLEPVLYGRFAEPERRANFPYRHVAGPHFKHLRHQVRPAFCAFLCPALSLRLRTMSALDQRSPPRR